LDSHTLTTIIADYLRDRDDVATAAILNEDALVDDPHVIAVKTQGGVTYMISVSEVTSR
jgi:archaellum component FlaG (FlaF/FlaG flagellin family)